MERACGVSGISEAQFRELQNNVANGGKSSGVVPRPLSSGSRKSKPKPVVFEGPVDVTLTLHGHCPSKKNDWERGGAGKMFLPAEVTAQIDTLITQALFHWRIGAPIEHPELTVTFFVAAKRQDQDGMYVTILDVLQKAGVLLNDNIKSNNGWKHLPPCEFVSVSDERVDIRVVKK